MKIPSEIELQHKLTRLLEDYSLYVKHAYYVDEMAEELHDYLMNYNSKEESKDESFVEKSPILIRVYNNKGFTEEDKLEVETLLKSKEPTEEDKVNLKKILLAHYQAKSDKVAVKKEKQLQIDEFVNKIYE